MYCTRPELFSMYLFKYSPHGITIKVVGVNEIHARIHVACSGEKINAYSILVRSSEGEIPLRRPSHR